MLSSRFLYRSETHDPYTRRKERLTTGCPKKVPLKISSFVVKRALSYLCKFIIASKTNRQFNQIFQRDDNARLTTEELISKSTFLGHPADISLYAWDGCWAAIICIQGYKILEQFISKNIKETSSLEIFKNLDRYSSFYIRSGLLNTFIVF